MDSLQRCLEILHEAHYGPLTTEFDISPAQGLAATGQAPEGLTLIDRTIQLVESNGDFVYMPESSRKAIFFSPARSPGTIRPTLALCAHWNSAVDIHARMGLRAATDLAVLRTAEGRSDSARALLQPVLEQFAEGFDTADLPRPTVR